MLINTVLQQDNIVLKNIFESDCTEKYLHWLNDKEINIFLTTYWKDETIESIKNFVTVMNNSTNNLLLGIFYNSIHIGNIKLGPIDFNNNYAYIGYLIGEKEYWNKGIATKSCKLLCDYAFSTYKLHKIYAGIRSTHYSSIKVIEKSGFEKEATLHNDAAYLYKGNYVDSYIYSIFNKKIQ